jgi:GNAT superfamily N-acetyltransferase
MDGLTYRRGGPEDYAALLDLYAVAYGKSFYLDWLRWWNEGGPLANGLRLACDGQRVVGAYGLMPIKLRVNDSTVKASLCTNVCVHPSLQGQGIFTALGMYALAGEIPLGTPVSIGFPNPKALPGHLKIGWDVLCDLPEMVKYRLKVQTNRCVEVDVFGTELDYFHRRVTPLYSLLCIKGYEWMNWRLRRTGASYTRFVYRLGNEISGYAVLKRYGFKAHIVDLMAETREALNALLDAAESFAADSDELNVWTSSNDPWHGTLLERGYIARPTTDKLIMHTNYGEHVTPDASRPWHVCRLDSDVY